MIAVRRVETDAELEAWRAVRIEVVPDERTLTVAELRALETPERLLVIAELDGDVAGCGLADRGMTGSRGFVAPRVCPDARRRGIGSALLRELVAHVRTLGIATLAAHVDAADAGSVAFARRYGFSEVDRQVEQVKRLGGEADPEFPAGVEIVPIAERPGLLREAYPLAQEAYADMATDLPVSVSLDDWLAEEATHPGGSFVALADGEIVGYSGLMRDPDQPWRAEDGLTAVRRDRRGRGLATALKRAELAWASRNGIREVYTWTQRGNHAMRAVNERLGYEYRHVELTVTAPLEAVEAALARVPRTAAPA